MTQYSMMIGCLRLSDVSVICRVTVLSTCVGRRRKFGAVSCTECTGQRNDFESILIFDIFLRLLEKRPLTAKVLKFFSENFHHDTDRRVAFEFCEIWPTANR